MVCSEKDTALNISIPVVMLPKSSGETITKSITDGKRGEPFYSCIFKVHEIFLNYHVMCSGLLGISYLRLNLKLKMVLFCQYR